MAYPDAAWERAMTVQEVILKALSGEIHWFRAADILGWSPRTLRRWRERYETQGYVGLVDKRRRRACSHRRATAGRRTGWVAQGPGNSHRVDRATRDHCRRRSSGLSTTGKGRGFLGAGITSSNVHALWRRPLHTRVGSTTRGDESACLRACVGEAGSYTASRQTCPARSG